MRQRVLATVELLGGPHGREDSFKIGLGQLVADRLLVALPTAGLPEVQLQQAALALGMPPAAWAVLQPRLAAANAVFFGTEEGRAPPVCKMYLEFWDEARRAVRAGAHGPQLVHLGVKWSSARPGHFEQAHYECHPLLSARDVLRRMGGVHGEQAATSRGLEPARAILRDGLKRSPGASFLYLEVREDANPRSSFDVNVYKAGLRVADAARHLEEAARRFGVAQAEMAAQLHRLGDRPLGHLSGGLDRRGEEFLSVYAEIAPMP